MEPCGQYVFREKPLSVKTQNAERAAKVRIYFEKKLMYLFNLNYFFLNFKMVVNGEINRIFILKIK
jgi:hypothetical protein